MSAFAKAMLWQEQVERPEADDAPAIWTPEVEQYEGELDNFFHAGFSAAADLDSALAASCPCGQRDCRHTLNLKAARALIRRTLAELEVQPCELAELD